MGSCSLVNGKLDEQYSGLDRSCHWFISRGYVPDSAMVIRRDNKQELRIYADHQGKYEASIHTFACTYDKISTQYNSLWCTSLLSFEFVG